MKKLLISVAGFIVLAFLITVNLNLSNERNYIKVNEQIKATDGYIMQNVKCPQGGTYDRCEPDPPSSCDVHLQTLC